MGYLERYKRRKKIVNSVNIYSDLDDSSVNELLNSNIDQNRIAETYKLINEHYAIDFNFTVEPYEVEEFLSKFRKEFNDRKFKELMNNCKKEVVSSIVKPFGIGEIISKYDKDGGNVTTIHNANKNIYANEEDKYRRRDYTNTKNSNGKQFAGQGKNSIGSQYTRSQMDDNSNVEDAYTGKIQKADTTSPDHIESLSQYHKNGGFMQNNTKKADFATDENNLALTDRRINQSMRDFDKKEWLEKSKNGIKNKDRFGIDEKKLNKAIEKGKKTAKKHLPTNFEKVQYYTKKSAITGVSEGAKMGIQQALGMVITEFFSSIFDEIMDVYQKGFFNNFEDESIFEVLKNRIKRIADRIKKKWKDVFAAFGEGCLSGFISNLTTTIINIFNTTKKRIVRIIREGIFSLFKAIKLLLFPPDNMTFKEAMHEAKKLLVSGIIISIGVIVEESINNIISTIPVLKPFADILTSVFVGTITGITIALAVYYIDRKKNDEEIFNALVANTEDKFERLDKLIKELEYNY